MEDILTRIVNDPTTHSKWLNTLSMMENSGARKIKNCEHPIFVNEIILKHAAEEARHAYYLKKQIQKIEAGACPTYEKQYLLAPSFSYYYLDVLDVKVCKYLKANYGFESDKLKYAAYLLVTYAIEVRADELYPIYQNVLTACKNSVNVKSIIAEEENHLKEMKAQLLTFSPHWEQMCEDTCAVEKELFMSWYNELGKEIAGN